MRTTVQLDDVLAREAEDCAARYGVSLTALVEEALREKLARATVRPLARRQTLPTFRGRGLQPGVDLHRTAELEQRMNGAGA